MEQMQLKVGSRTDKGKGASRRLRRLSGYLPAIIYGGEPESQSISIEHKELIKLTQHESFFSQVLVLDVEGKKEDVIVKAMQRHPYKDLIMHVDFQRVSADTKITVQLPIHLLNEDNCIGVKSQGGILFRDMLEVEITCLPSKLPEYLEIDVTNLEVGHSIHVTEIALPEGVQVTALLQSEDYDAPVVKVSKVVEQVEEDDAPEADAAGDADADGDKEGS